MKTFCWRSMEDQNVIYGPFDSVEEAKVNVVDWFSEDENNTIEICYTTPIDPKEWSKVLNTYDIIEKMDDQLYADVHLDDNPFSIPEEVYEQAQTELDALIMSWVEKYVETNGEWTCGEVVEVTSVEKLYREV